MVMWVEESWWEVQVGEKWWERLRHSDPCKWWAWTTYTQ